MPDSIKLNKKVWSLSSSSSRK